MSTPQQLVMAFDIMSAIAFAATVIQHRRNRAAPVELGRVITVRWVAGQSSRRKP